MLLLTLFSKIVASLLAPIVIVVASAGAHRVATIIKPVANDMYTVRIVSYFPLVALDEWLV